MRTPAQAAGRRAQDELAMTSMIDVVFLLLVFFVWTSSFDRPESNLPGGIAMQATPKDPTGPQPLADNDPPPVSRNTELIVRISQADGGLFYRVGAVDLEDIASLKSKLTRIAGLPITPLVIVDPDKAVSVADSIKVFDLARRIGFKRVWLAVDDSSS